MSMKSIAVRVLQFGEYVPGPGLEHSKTCTASTQSNKGIITIDYFPLIRNFRVSCVKNGVSSTCFVPEAQVLSWEPLGEFDL